MLLRILDRDLLRGVNSITPKAPGSAALAPISATKTRELDAILLEEAARHGCTRQIINLSICQICRYRLPITPNGRRYNVPDSLLCDRCAAPKLSESGASSAARPLPDAAE